MAKNQDRQPKFQVGENRRGMDRTAGVAVNGARARQPVPHDITSDGRMVWVNGAAGLLGRFGPNGIDARDRNERGA